MYAVDVVQLPLANNSTQFMAVLLIMAHSHRLGTAKLTGLYAR